ncbi:MAG: TetR family transcriptional regulator [Nocardioides sp.]
MPKIDAPTLAEHHTRRRGDILRTATRLLREGGVSAVTPAAVAAGAGLARSSVYQYYASTGALVGAAYEEMFAEALKAVRAAVAVPGGPAEEVLAYLDAAVELAEDGHAPMPVDQGRMEMPPECIRRVGELHRELVEPLTGALARAGVGDPVGVAELLNAVAGAAAAQRQRGESADSVRVRLHRFVRAALTLGEAPSA